MQFGNTQTKEKLNNIQELKILMDSIKNNKLETFDKSINSKSKSIEKITTLKIVSNINYNENVENALSFKGGVENYRNPEVYNLDTRYLFTIVEFEKEEPLQYFVYDKWYVDDKELQNALTNKMIKTKANIIICVADKLSLRENKITNKSYILNIPINVDTKLKPNINTQIWGTVDDGCRIGITNIINGETSSTILPTIPDKNTEPTKLDDRLTITATPKCAATLNISDDSEYLANVILIKPDNKEANCKIYNINGPFDESTLDKKTIDLLKKLRSKKYHFITS